MHSLHHFQVYKETISTTPCRRVFDASFRTKGDISLKDCRTKGPFLTPSILKVQLCMRRKKYPMCAGVSEAYLGVLMRYVQINFACCFARKVWDPGSLVEVFKLICWNCSWIVMLIIVFLNWILYEIMEKMNKEICLRIVREKKVVAPSLCTNLNLCLDDKGILRLFTSLVKCKHLSHNTKFPILLPRDDHVTKLFIRDHHVIGGHLGVQQTMNSVRTKIWIPKFSQIVPQVSKSCVNGKNYFSQRYHVPASPPLSKFRVSDVDPFILCGVDMT